MKKYIFYSPFFLLIFILFSCCRTSKYKPGGCLPTKIIQSEVDLRYNSKDTITQITTTFEYDSLCRICEIERTDIITLPKSVEKGKIYQKIQLFYGENNRVDSLVDLLAKDGKETIIRRLRTEYEGDVIKIIDVDSLSAWDELKIDEYSNIINLKQITPEQITETKFDYVYSRSGNIERIESYLESELLPYNVTMRERNLKKFKYDDGTRNPLSVVTQPWWILYFVYETDFVTKHSIGETSYFSQDESVFSVSTYKVDYNEYGYPMYKEETLCSEYQDIYKFEYKIIEK